jgi:hypothetical protein
LVNDDLLDSLFIKYDIKDEELRGPVFLLGGVLSLSNEERQLMSSVDRRELLEGYNKARESFIELKSMPEMLSYLDIDQSTLDDAIVFAEHDISVYEMRRATKLTILYEMFHPFIFKLRKTGFSWSKCVDLIYDLFTLFEFENYGQGEEEYDQVEDKISEVEANQKDRIRKQFVDPTSRVYDKLKSRYGK